MLQRRLLCALRHQVGRRGFFLITLGYVDLVYAYRLAWPRMPLNERDRYLADAIPFFADQRRSLIVWAGIWALVGVLCLINAFRTDDRWGYGPAAGLKVAWTLTMAVAGINGYSEGWRSASVWLLTAAAVLVISTWPEEARPLTALAAEAEEREDAAEAAAEEERVAEADREGNDHA